MSLTLTAGAITVQLSEDLFWSDEYSWAPVAQSVQPSVTGALIVQQGVRQAGRPITLEPEDDFSAWLERSSLDQLRAWVGTPGLTLTLAGLRGQSRQVIFRQHDGALDARPVFHFSDVDAADSYRVTLRLMEI